MDSHLKQYYSDYPEDTPRGNFHKVIPLHKNTHLSWEKVIEMVPSLPKGWFELSHIQVQDRIEFTRDFWLAKLPYHPRFPEFLMKFFSKIDSIEIYIVQQKYDDPFEAHLVYSLKNDSGFYRGFIPASEEDLNNLKKTFPDFIFPPDYLAFLQIHNGFCKTTDCTGITKSKHVGETYQKFQTMLLNQQIPVATTKGATVNPHTLVPFYESFGMPFYQCFWAEWYPENEMGNVYYSGINNTISDVQGKDLPFENLAFTTFVDWLMFYLEQIE